MKKTDQIAVHIDHGSKMAIAAIAEIDGMTASEYVCNLIHTDLQRKYHALTVLQEWAKGTGTVGTDGTE